MPENATVTRARELRRTMSLPEGLLWQVLRTRPAGLKFRRQHPLGPYVADFYCPSRKLIVEVDGAGHDSAEAARRDAGRSAWLRQQGFRLICYLAADVLRDPHAVADDILARIGAPPLHRAPHGPPPHRPRWGETKKAGGIAPGRPL